MSAWLYLSSAATFLPQYVASMHRVIDWKLVDGLTIFRHSALLQELLNYVLNSMWFANFHCYVRWKHICSQSSSDNEWKMIDNFGREICMAFDLTGRLKKVQPNTNTCLIWWNGGQEKRWKMMWCPQQAQKSKNWNFVTISVYVKGIQACAAKVNIFLNLSMSQWPFAELTVQTICNSSFFLSILTTSFQWKSGEVVPNQKWKIPTWFDSLRLLQLHLNYR